MAWWTYTLMSLPDADHLDCERGGATPQLVPFASLSDIDLAARGWTDPALWQLVFNVVLFIPFGMLVRHPAASTKALWVVLAGAGASLLIEVTQLTGIWGLYPCAYRVFDVDDLLTNTLGAAIGVTLAPFLQLVPGQEVMPRDVARVVGRARRLLGMAVDYVAVFMATFALDIPVALVARETGWFGTPVPYEAIGGWATVVVAVLLLFGVPWFARGATLGQLATLVRPMDAAGEAPTPSAMVRRWGAGSGGYFVVSGLGDITGQGILDVVATAWLVLSALVVLAVHPRGPSGYASGLTVVDARDRLTVDTRARETDPRSLGRAVVVLGGIGVVVLVLASLTLVPFLASAGITTARREGRSLATILPLLAAVGLVGVVVLLGVAVWAGLWWLIALAVAVVVVTGYLGFLFVAFLLYGQWYARRTPALPVDAVVVLGSRVFGERVPPLLAARIDRGIEVLHDSIHADPAAGTVLVCSGGQGLDEELAEGDAMARYAAAHGVPEHQLLREVASRNTEENLRLSRALLDEHGFGPSMVVVTNDYHAFRAGIIAREVGVAADVVGAPTARYYFPSAVIREFIGVLARSPWVHGVIAFVLAAGTAALVALIMG